MRRSNINSENMTYADAFRVEHKILDHVKNALRVTLDWQVPDIGVARKLSSMKFALESFQRHFGRLISMEEDGGYMKVVAECKPYLHDKAAALREEHDAMRTTLADIIISTENMHDCDPNKLSSVCNEIASLLAKVDRHDRSEIELLQEAILTDEGGEG